MNLDSFETAVSNELGLSKSAEKTTIDDALNTAVQRVLEDTHCYVKPITYSSFDGTTSEYDLATLGGSTTILDIVEMQLTSTGTIYSLERLGVVDLLERARVGQPGGSPTQFYTLLGGNLLKFWPAPGAGDTLTMYVVPVPAAMSASGDDPSTNSLGGVPTILHEAIFYAACKRLASYDDDQSSAQGQRYQDWYDKELQRYMKIMRKRGGVRLARAVVNDKKRRRPFHTNDIYPAS